MCTKPIFQPPYQQSYGDYTKALVLGAAMGLLCKLLSSITVLQLTAPSRSYFEFFMLLIIAFIFSVSNDCSHIVLTPLVVLFVYHAVKEVCRRTFSPQFLAWLFLASTLPLIFASLNRVLTAPLATLNDLRPLIPAATADLCVITAMLPALFFDAATRNQRAVGR
ncbi:MAG: hypothetical protein ACJZ8O_03535 [Pirellulaceae bacterium]